MKLILLALVLSVTGFSKEPCESFLDTVIQRLDARTYVILRNGDIPVILKSRGTWEQGRWVINARLIGSRNMVNNAGFERTFPVYSECAPDKSLMLPSRPPEPEPEYSYY